MIALRRLAEVLPHGAEPIESLHDRRGGKISRRKGCWSAKILTVRFVGHFYLSATFSPT